MKRVFSLLTVITVTLILAFGTITTFMATANDITDTETEPPEIVAVMIWDADNEVWIMSLHVNGESFLIEIDNLSTVVELLEELENIVQLLGDYSPIQFNFLPCEDCHDCKNNEVTVYEPAPSPSPTPLPTLASGDTIVFLSRTGTRWHSVNNCGNMNPNNAISVTLEYARERDDLEACSRCNAPE